MPQGVEIAGAEIVIGAPSVRENLTIFPILAKSQVDVGPITTLDAAMREAKAEVREVGANAQNAPNANAEGGATVGTLMIENKGKVPIYVLAGTVVRGGNQDRQIGQDFVVEPLASVPIDAFCVERGRWTDVREGQATAGKFGSTGTLAVANVRAAAQYKKDQGEVWQKVQEVNDVHGKSADTGTLLATLDDAAVKARIAKLTRGSTEALAAAQPQDRVVGFAYAIDGKVRAVRWFAHRRVFELFRGKLLEAAALDAITAQGGAPAKAPPALAPEAVSNYMTQVDQAPAEEAATPAANVNEYRKSQGGYGSKVKLKPKACASGDPLCAHPPPAPTISRDYYFF